MYIFDTNGSLVNLSDKDIEIVRAFSSLAAYDAEVRARGPVGAWYPDGEYEVRSAYTLHCGTVAECRDFVSQLATKLGGAIRIEASSTKRPEEPEPATDRHSFAGVNDDLPF